MKKELIKNFKTSKLGSALIMTMVLTVLLAIIAVMFVAVARMDRASTSNIADNKSLDLAAKSITEIICKDITKDIPGMTGYDPNKYCTYPDANHLWLASLEPYLSRIDGSYVPPYKIYRWRQISDVTNFLKTNGFEVNDVNADPQYGSGPGNQGVIKEYPEITLNPNGTIKNSDVLADADGDGIADSKWIELKGIAGSNWNMRSSKGQKIYAAVRVIDNGGMVNVNTADKFDVNSIDANTINGASQMQINLAGLLKGTDSIVKLHQTRCGSDSNTWSKYEKNVIWDYNSVPGGNYLPFDISDELELRYRYCIDSKFVSRFEVNDPCTSRAAGNANAKNSGKLYDTHTNIFDVNWGLADWQNRITNFNDPCADRRHLLTAYNLDRIIDPCGAKMTNINDANVNVLYNKIHAIIPNANTAAQIAVNIIDYRDSNSNVTTFDANGATFYGFEQPCVYISELAYRQVTTPGSPPTVNKSYAIELYNPYGDQIALGNGWKINGAALNWTGTGSFFVIKQEDPSLTFTIDPAAGRQDDVIADFSGATQILLTRTVDVGGTLADIVVDSVDVPAGLMIEGDHSYRRDIAPARCIMRLWDPTISNTTTLGLSNNYDAGGSYIQAHPKNAPFTNVGEIGMILRKPAYFKPLDPCSNVIGYDTNNTEAQVRLNLADPDPNYQKLFKYLTVWPRSYALGPNATIKGRININTAPASVIAQLPWVSLRSNPPDYNNANLAKAIVAYRDKQNLTATGGNYSTRSGYAGFRTIGELCKVNLGSDPNFDIDYYSRGIKTGDQIGPPDIDNTPLNSGDGAIDDFKERDLIFTRISDLVTVRSDIFTAYILVRIGTDGPQKRYMVILDRSGVDAKKLATDPTNRVKIIAFQPVPQAR